jgi:hypothetical protein
VWSLVLLILLAIHGLISPPTLLAWVWIHYKRRVVPRETRLNLILICFGYRSKYSVEDHALVIVVAAAAWYHLVYNPIDVVLDLMAEFSAVDVEMTVDPIHHFGNLSESIHYSCLVRHTTHHSFVVAESFVNRVLEAEDL